MIKWISGLGFCFLLSLSPFAGVTVVGLSVISFVWWPLIKRQLVGHVVRLQEENGELENKLAAARKRGGQLNRALEAEREAKEQAEALAEALAMRARMLEEECLKVSRIEEILGNGRVAETQSLAE